MGTGHRSFQGKGSEPVSVLHGRDAHEVAFEAEVEKWAWRRMRSLRTFYAHLTVFAIINICVLVYDFVTPGRLFFFFPLLTWGLVLALHAAHTYERLPWFTRDWEKRKVQELIEERRAQRR